MRISDWSSDVCSSDLEAVGLARAERQQADRCLRRGAEPGQCLAAHQPGGGAEQPRVAVDVDGQQNVAAAPEHAVDRRSAEHKSALQSLMRNSYAVSCLKKQQATAR